MVLKISNELRNKISGLLNFRVENNIQEIFHNGMPIKVPAGFW